MSINIGINFDYVRSRDKSFREAVELAGKLGGCAGNCVTSVCLASITFSGQRQLFFPIGDNYVLYSLVPASYSGADRSRG